MARYYVSATGNDSNDGSLAHPWKTVTRVNTAFSSSDVGRGDTVYFEKGSTYYGRLRLPDSIDPTNPGWLSVDSYGSGALPVISGYKLATSWVQHNSTTWKTDLSSSAGYDGAQGFGDVGFIKTDATIRGVKRASLAELSGQWDFYSSGSMLYVHSSSSPLSLATTISVATDGDGVNLRSGTRVRHIEVSGHGGHGIAAPGNGGSTRCRVDGCIVREIGGAYLDGYGDGQVRYGNGIQVWVDSADILIENTTIADCYDCGFTIQGGDSSLATTYDTIIFRRNLIYRSSQSMEYWYGGSGAGFIDCKVEYNTCLFAGYGWGADVRPVQDIRVHILTYGWETTAGLSITNNIFYDGRVAYRYTFEDPTGLVSERNIILLRPLTLMNFQDTETIENAAQWATADGRDETSLFVTLPASEVTTISDNDIHDALMYLDQIPYGQHAGSRYKRTHAQWL